VPGLDPDLLAAGGVRLELSPDAPVATVTLDRPDTRNAQTPATWRALTSIGETLPDAIRVVVLRGSGPVFSSGIDLRTFTADGVDGESTMAAIAAVDDDGAADLIAEFQRAFTWWHDRDVLTVAVVQGAAVGAGFQLALACDLRVCSTAARFSMRETSLGLVPDLTGTHPLVRAVGYGRAVEMCVTGRWIGADEAQSLGLASAVVEPDDLDETVGDLVAALLAAPDASARATKAVLRSALTADAHAQREFERRAQIPLLRGLLGSG
jgi:enoyl-CoA hydratase/carnithine racemase